MKNITIFKTCKECHERRILVVPEDGYLLWQNGALIQSVMPTVSAGDRELLISGYCSKCFDKLWED